MEIQKKLTLLFSALFLFFVLGFILYFRIEQKHLIRIQEQIVEDKKTELTQIIRLNYQPILALVDDYSRWDEMVEVIKTRDQQWAAIDIDIALKMYQADAAWVYGLDAELVYSVNYRNDAAAQRLPFDQTQFGKIFAEQKMAHFFVEATDGFYEVHGAAVHPSDDLQRTTPAQGYFFVGKFWGAKYLNELSALSGCQITLRRVTNAGRSPVSGYAFAIDAKGWDQEALFQIIATTNSSRIKDFQEYSRQFLRLFAFYSMFQFLFMAYNLRKVLKTPQPR